MISRKSGFRSITVDGHRYKWSGGGIVSWLGFYVIPFDGGGTTLDVEFPGVVAPRPGPIGSDGKIGVILPSHVARAVRTALAQGWQPEASGKTFHLSVSYQDYKVPLIWGTE
jgi:hypothetical protein